MIEKIEEFLREKPGYQKEGPLRLKKTIVKQLELDPTVEECRQALRNIRSEERDIVVDNDITKTTVSNSDDGIPEGFRIKSRWQNSKGEWLTSLERVDSEEDIEDLIDSFKEVIEEEDILIEIPKVKGGRKDLKIWTSDKHLGACTKDAMHDNEYNLEVFESRMTKILIKIAELFNQYGVFHTITVADLGDAIDGMDGYTVSRTHSLPQNLSNQEMFDGYLRIHKRFYDTLFNSGYAENYQVWLVTNSNHGGDFEYACHGALKVYIEGVYPEVSVKNLPDFLNLVKHNGIHYILSHGKDKTNRKFGLPLYPNEKTEVLIENFLKVKDIPRSARVRLIKGDLHQSASCPAKNLDRYRTVGSIFGSSGWVMDNFGMTEAACDYEILDIDTQDITEGTIKLQ